MDQTREERDVVSAIIVGFHFVDTSGYIIFSNRMSIKLYFTPIPISNVFCKLRSKVTF